jgi:hypothetical protein
MAVPAPGAVAAGTAVERIFYTVETAPAGLRALESEPTPSGPSSGPLTPDNVDVEYLATSHDGSREADVEFTYPSSSGGAASSERLVVRDVSGRVVRVVDHTPCSVSAPCGFSNVVLSPDASTVAYSFYDGVTNKTFQRRAQVAAGASVSTLDAPAVAAFVDETTVLVRTGGGFFTQPVAGGALTAVTGLPGGASNPVFDPPSSRLVWAIVEGSAGSGYWMEIQDALVTLANGTNGTSMSVGTATTLATGVALFDPGFSRSGGSVYYLDQQAATGWQYVFSVPADGSGSPSRLDPSSTDVVGAMGVASTDDGTAPGAPSPAPASVAGTSATLHWTLPSDTDLSGVLISRNGGPAHYVPAPGTVFVDTGLVAGTTYSYAFTAVDRSNNLSDSATRQLTAIAAGATFADPTSTTSIKAAFPVRFARTAPSTVHFTVDYLTGGTTSWKHWVLGAAGLTRTFGAPATTGVAATTSVAGATYTFRVKATDAYGNSTSTVQSGKAVVPYDQTKATLSGGTTIGSSLAYFGSLRQLKSTSSYAKVTLFGNRLQIIGWKCKTCGKFVIYDGGTKLATVDTYATSGTVRSVLFTRTYTAIGTHTFTIRSLATYGRPAVDLDAFAMRR